MKIFTIALVVAIIIGGTLLVWPKYLRSRSLQRRDAEMAQRIEARRAEIDEMLERQRRFHSDRDFVESIARQSRRVYPGELVFVFSDDK